MKQETPSLSLSDDSASGTVAKRSYQWRRSRIAWLLVAPSLLLLAAVAGWPLFRTLFYSFTDAMLDSPDEYRFVGLSNYFDFAAGGIITVCWPIRCGGWPWATRCVSA